MSFYQEATFNAIEAFPATNPKPKSKKLFADKMNNTVVFQTDSYCTTLT